MRPPPFILALKSNASKGPETGPRRRPSSGIIAALEALNCHSSLAAILPAHGLTPPKPVGRGTPRPHPKPAHGGHTAATAGSSSHLPCAWARRRASGQKWTRAAPANVSGCRLRQARCSAFPTLGWGKTILSTVQKPAVSCLYVLRRDMKFYSYLAQRLFF